VTLAGLLFEVSSGVRREATGMRARLSARALRYYTTMSVAVLIVRSLAARVSSAVRT